MKCFLGLINSTLRVNLYVFILEDSTHLSSMQFRSCLDVGRFSWVGVEEVVFLVVMIHFANVNSLVCSPVDLLHMESTHSKYTLQFQ